MTIFEECATNFREEFDMENVDGGTCEIFVNCDEDFMIGMAYVADCHTYKRHVDLEKFYINSERSKMVDLFLSLLKFEWRAIDESLGANTSFQVDRRRN